MPANFAVAVTIRAIDEVSKTLNRVTGNVSKQGASLKALGGNIASVTAPRQMADSVSTLKTEISGIGSSLEVKRLVAEIESGTSRAAGSFKLLGSAAKDAFSVLATSGVVIGGLSFASNRMFSDISKSNIELKHEANRLNTTPDKLRSYRLAAESVGTPAASINSAFGRINDMAFQFKVGNTAPSQAIAALNSRHQGAPISLLDKNNRLRSPELILMEFAEKLNQSKLPQQTKVQFANDFLGGSDLLPLMGLGSQGMHKRAAQFQGEDYTKSDQATTSYLVATTKFEAALDRLKRLASIEILPGISKGLDGISEWIKNNGDSLKALFRDIGSGIPREMNTALRWVSLFVRGLTLVSNTIGVANLAFGLMSLSIGFKLGKAVWGIVRAFAALKNSLMVAQGIRVVTGLIVAFPFATALAGYLAVIAVISAVTYAIVKYRKTIAGWISSAVSWFESINPVFHVFISVIGKAIESVTNLFTLMGRPPVLKAEIVTPKNNDSFPFIFKNSTNKSDFLEQILQSSRKRSSNKSDEKQNAEVTVRFENLPQGTRIEQSRGNTFLNLDAGYATVGVFS